MPDLPKDNPCVPGTTYYRDKVPPGCPESVNTKPRQLPLQTAETKASCQRLQQRLYSYVTRMNSIRIPEDLNDVFNQPSVEIIPGAILSKPGVRIKDARGNVLKYQSCNCLKDEALHLLAESQAILDGGCAPSRPGLTQKDLTRIEKRITSSDRVLQMSADCIETITYAESPYEPKAVPNQKSKTGASREAGKPVLFAR